LDNLWDEAGCVLGEEVAWFHGICSIGLIAYEEEDTLGLQIEFSMDILGSLTTIIISPWAFPVASDIYVVLYCQFFFKIEKLDLI